MVYCIKKELIDRKKFLTHDNIETIYFGGGTPSLLSATEVKEILKTIHQEYNVSENPEITLEANPEDLTLQKCKELVEAGVNRLSIGIQSFRDEQLKFMNRAHTSSQAFQAVYNAQEAGITNISIDLIYGLPQLSPSAFKIEVEKALSLSVNHISAYCLTVEPQTSLYQLVKTGKVIPEKDETINTQFDYLVEELANSGFEHYEISNFALPNHYSNHNTNYWKGVKYLGIGPGAHGYDGKNRYWNINNNPAYIKAVTTNMSCINEEVLSLKDRYNEYVMTSLRTMWGCDLNKIKTENESQFLAHLNQEIKPYLASNLIRLENNHLILTKKGKHFADKIASDLFYL